MAIPNSNVPVALVVLIINKSFDLIEGVRKWILTSVAEALPYSLLDHIHQERVAPQRVREVEPHLREPRAQCGAGGGQILANVNAGREEVRHENHFRCTRFHTLDTTGFDVRFSQLQVRHANERIPPPRAQLRCNELQIGVRFCSAAAMCDE